MNKHEELNKELSRISEIFINAKENFDYCYYLHKPDTVEELKYINIDRNLKFIRHSLWRLSIIELTKLFSDRKATHKFNLIQFIQKLKSNGVYASAGIRCETIQVWERSINNYATLIAKIISLRDKIYAHTDPDKDSYRDIEIYFTQIERLFNIVAIIIKELNSSVFKVHIELRNPSFDRNHFDLVKILAAEYKRGIEELEKYIRK